MPYIKEDERTVAEILFGQTISLIEKKYSTFLYLSVIMLMFNLLFLSIVMTMWRYSLFINLVLLILPFYLSIPPLTLLLRLERIRRTTYGEYVGLRTGKVADIEKAVSEVIKLNAEISRISRMILLYVISSGFITVTFAILLQLISTW